MFRRAGNYIARIEDALVFNGRPGPDAPPPFGVRRSPEVYSVSGGGSAEGLLSASNAVGSRCFFSVAELPGDGRGSQVVRALVQSVNALDEAGQLGPYACVLSPDLIEAVCPRNNALILPRDRILPFLQGRLRRSSVIPAPCCVVLALSGSPIDLVLARDIHLKFLQTTEQPSSRDSAFRYQSAFALRIEESAAIAVLR